MAKKPFKNSIKNVYKRFINYSFIMAILTFVLGLIVLFVPGISTKIAGVIAGVSCIASGLCSLYNYLKRDGAKLFALSIVFASLYFVLGLILILYPYSAMTFVTVCLGLYLLFKGALKIDYAMWFKRGNEDCWLITLVSGIMVVIIGILLLFNPFAAGLTLAQIVGAFMMIMAVVDFSNTLMFKKRTKEIMDIFW